MWSALKHMGEQETGDGGRGCMLLGAHKGGVALVSTWATVQATVVMVHAQRGYVL